MYIKTNHNLYLGSDENGLLFLGNVTKHYQIWTVESNKDSLWSFKNHYGLYLCGEKSGRACANRKNKKDWEKFRIYNIDQNMMNMFKPPRALQAIDDEIVVPISDKHRNRMNKRRQSQSRRDRKMSIDDMDIPASIDKQLLSLHYPSNNKGHKPYNKRGHNRRASARVHVKPPPKPRRKGSGHVPKRATTPPPKDAKFDFASMPMNKMGEMQHSQSAAHTNRPPPPPRLNRNNNNEISISLAKDGQNQGVQIRKDSASRRRMLLEGVKNKSMRSVSNEDPGMHLEPDFRHQRSRSMVSIVGSVKGAVPAIGGMGMMLGGDDLLMAELSRKLAGRRKSTLKAKEGKVKDESKKEENADENEENDTEEQLENVVEDGDDHDNVIRKGTMIIHSDAEEDEDDDNEDDIKEMQDMDKDGMNVRKPALLFDG